MGHWDKTMKQKKYFEVHAIRSNGWWGWGALFQKGWKAVRVGPVIVLVRSGTRWVAR